MALKPCKECGKEISTKATSCPNCGIKIVRTSGCAWLALFGLIVLVSIIVISVASGPATPTRHEDRPSAAITKNMAELRITNKDSSTWPRLTLYVNGLSSYRYTYKQSVQPGSTIFIGLMNFTKGDGERFDPIRYDVKEVWLEVPGRDLSKYGF